ncbi:MAG: MmcB family DNA repair protein [Hyphomicrobiales bacterium]|nr:MmcB family DNA repair protein [Hyphomicrobiales bacterium]
MTSEFDPDRAAVPALEAPVDGRQSPAALTIRRGVGRLMRAGGFSLVAELGLASGRRADLVALGPKTELVIIEIKSSLEDLRADNKWPDYRAHCDRLFFATRPGVPLDAFPEDAGLILADGFGAEILREAPEHRLAGATRRAVLLRFARAAAQRLHDLEDPGLRGRL